MAVTVDRNQVRHIFNHFIVRFELVCVILAFALWHYKPRRNTSFVRYLLAADDRHLSKKKAFFLTMFWYLIIDIIFNITLLGVTFGVVWLMDKVMELIP